VWQGGLLVGFVLWAILAIRGLKPLLDREPVYGLAHMILYAGGSITLLFVAGFMFTPSTNMAVTEFWRWWVVHMWVEGAFEFFIVAIIGLTLVSMNLLSRRSAREGRDAAGPARDGDRCHRRLAPLLVDRDARLLGPDREHLLDAGAAPADLHPLRGDRAVPSDDRIRRVPLHTPLHVHRRQRVWNFVGAGVLGFFINLPLINYYEHGTYLTVGHAHAAMFGAFGFLALGMVAYMLQLSIDPERWDGSWLRASFWCWNVGLALMVFVSVLPVGFLQLEVAFTEGYAAARSLAFYEGPLVQTLFWARLPGDSLLILGTVIYFADLIRKRFVLRRSADDPSVDDMAVAEGVQRRRLRRSALRRKYPGAVTTRSAPSKSHAERVCWRSSDADEQRDTDDGVDRGVRVQHRHAHLGRGRLSVRSDDVELREDLRTEQHEQDDRLAHVDLEVHDDRDGEEALCRGDPDLRGLLGVEREGADGAGRDRVHDRERSDEQGPLVEL